MLSVSTWEGMGLSRTHSKMFVTCSEELKTAVVPTVCCIPFSSIAVYNKGICPIHSNVFFMYDLIHKLFYSSNISLPPTVIISTISPDNPAFPCLIFLTAAIFTTSVLNIAGPSTAVATFRELSS